jgi:hypothetical protein
VRLPYSHPQLRTLACALALLIIAAPFGSAQQAPSARHNSSATNNNATSPSSVAQQPTTRQPSTQTPASPPTSKYLVGLYPTLTGTRQSITFPPILSHLLTDQPFKPPVSASSHLDVKLSVQSGPATISNDNALTITGTGKVVVLASQAGNSRFRRATATRSFSVNHEPGHYDSQLEFAFDPPIQSSLTVGSGPVSVSTPSGSDGTITWSVQSGPATRSGNMLIVTKNDAEAGIVVLVAKQAAYGPYEPASATKTITVLPRGAYCLPGLLPSSAANVSKKVPSGGTNSAADTAASSLQGLISLLGSPDPFTFEPLGSDQIAIYSYRFPLNAQDAVRLNKIEAELDELNAAGAAGNASLAGAKKTSSTSSDDAGSPPPAFTLKLHVHEARSLGDLQARFSQAAGKSLTVTDAGSDSIWITSQTEPDCHELTQLLTDIRDATWHVHSVQPVVQVFHTQASDIADVLGGGKSASTGGSAPQTQTPSSTSQTGSPQPQKGSGHKGTDASNSKNSGASSQSKNGKTNSNTGASQGNGSKPVSSNPAADPPNQGASQASNGGNNSGDSTATDQSKTSPNPQENQSKAPSSLSPPAPLAPDLLLFSEADGVDDAAIREEERTIALLDLPRPEMLINIWSLQTSSGDADAVGDANTNIKKKVEEYNAGIQFAVNRGWAYLTSSMNPDFFDAKFYNYVTGRYIGTPRNASSSASDPNSIAQNYLDMRSQVSSSHLEAARQQVGACPGNQYCLGYVLLFNPLKPRLTDMLLATMASKTPGITATLALNAMECSNPNTTCAPLRTEGRTCQERDKIAEQRLQNNQGDHFVPVLFLECFRDVADAVLSDNTPQKGPGLYVRITRAAVADFLFNYKMSLEFPHEFSAYELTQSAQALNASLSPLIDAFNSDLVTYQSYLREQIRHPGDSADEESWIGMDKSTFVNDGIITVRTLSAKDTTISTQTQNFLDATQQPDIATLMSKLSTDAASLKPSDFLPEPVQLIQSALSTIQTSKIQIGRSLYLDVNPRSQAGASSAELDITMKVDDVSNPTYYSQSNSAANGSSADLSRVAQHDTQTRVRVDSIKLFEVSSFSAILQRSRPRFPLLPPFVELPYIGTILGVPLPAAKEYHSSTAFLSAIIVPTATDIANSITFVRDRIGWDDISTPCSSAADANAPCRVVLRAVGSWRELGDPIGDFHKAMISCLAGGQPYPNLPGQQNPEPITCDELSFDTVLHDYE